jgi:hypothetical protein
MKKLNENDLQEYVKKFNEKDLVFSLTGIVNVKAKMVNTKSSYNNKNGILKIEDTKSNMKIDTTSVYKIQVSENNSMLEIFLDNGINIRLEK